MGVERMGIHPILVALLVLSSITFTGCLEDGTDSRTEGEPTDERSDSVYFIVWTDKDRYDEDEDVIISVTLVSELDEGLNLTISGYRIDVYDESGNWLHGDNNCCRHMWNITVPPNSSTPYGNWTWNQTKWDYPYYPEVERDQYVKISCKFCVASGAIWPYGNRTIWLE